jgi:GWxTD domain-containing protein
MIIKHFTSYFIFYISYLLLGCVATPPSTNMPTKSVSRKVNTDTKNESTSGGGLSIQSKFLDNGNSIRLFVQIEPADKNDTQLVDNFLKTAHVSYTLNPDYVNKNILSLGNVPLTSQNTIKQKGSLLFWFDIAKIKDVYVAVAWLTIGDAQMSVLHDRSIRFQSGKVGDYFTLFDKTGSSPLMQPYLKVTDTVLVKDIANSNRKLMVLRYKHDFDPALPPTAIAPRAVTKSLFLDSLFFVETNKPFQLREEALYYFCKDTTEAYGFGITATDDRFPRYTRPEKLTKPLVYVSTLQEYTDLIRSKTTEDTKRALDRYFLNLSGGNQESAKKTIKAYYRRVEEANRLFTTYKEGWKTDKGMIFVIMGHPDKVSRSKDKEVWTYSKKGQFSDVSFTFIRRPNQFIEDHYELTRYAEFQPIWYPVVENWRLGDGKE